MFVGEQFVGMVKFGGYFIGNQQNVFVIVYVMNMFELLWMIYVYFVCVLNDRFQNYGGYFMMMCGYQVGKWCDVVFILFVIYLVLWCWCEQIFWQIVFL